MALAGLPPGKDIDVAPLQGASAASFPSVDYAAHYVRPKPAAGVASTRLVDEDTLARLRALGYIGAAESSAGRRLDGTRTAGSYNNEGLILQAQKKKAEAVKAFENALIVDPNLASAMWNLSDLLFDSAMPIWIGPTRFCTCLCLRPPRRQKIPDWPGHRLPALGSYRSQPEAARERAPAETRGSRSVALQRPLSRGEGRLCRWGL